MLYHSHRAGVLVLSDSTVAPVPPVGVSCWARAEEAEASDRLASLLWSSVV